MTAAELIALLQEHPPYHHVSLGADGILLPITTVGTYSDHEGPQVVLR